jgi:DeoR/GlpR family transcriptional regulator of sugar metabolism
MINGILGLLSFTFLLAGAAQEYHVSVTGDDRNKGNATNPLKTISAAAQLVQPGDTIIVHAGGNFGR